MHRNPEFVLVAVVAAVSIAALAYLFFFLSFGDAVGATGAVTAQVNEGTGSWFVHFVAGFFLLVVSATTIYHFWHHRG